MTLARRDLAKAAGGITLTADSALPRAEEIDNVHLIALQIIGVISGFGPILQTLLLNRLVEESRITLTQIGQAAGFEAAGMVLAASLFAAFIPPVRLKLLVCVSSILGVAANVATIYLVNEEILIARFINGISTGILLWVFIGALTRVHKPARQIAVHMTLQAVVVYGFGHILSSYLFPLGGSAAGYLTLAAGGAVIAACAAFIPAAYRPLAAGAARMPPTQGFVGLIAIGLHLSAILAAWVYAGPIGTAHGISEKGVGEIVSIALFLQIVAGVIVILLANRMNPVVVLLSSAVSSLAGLIMLASASGVIYSAGVAVIGFFWIFMQPFQMPYLIRLDPSRRTAAQSLTAQLIGVGIGPLIASGAVSLDGVSGSIWASAALFVVTGMIIIATLVRVPAVLRAVPNAA